MTPKEYFEKLPASLQGKADKVSSINAIYQFDIKGPTGGTWTVDLTAPGGKVTEGASASPNCTVTMEDENFVKLVTGALNPQMAFMTGKLKVAGNMGLALKLATII
ncbi:MAG TPA: SCP2 sterol-binding domain-containing protein [bacterium]|nr:SCP2 sterol-binding domain-containing protein [bacterium]